MKNSLRTLLVALLCLAALPAAARVSYTLNEGWEFRKGDDRTASEGWERICVPHTWNALDCEDDEPGYYRGPGWYRRTVNIAPEFAGKSLFLLFEGVASCAKVYVNGELAGSHEGGYSAFCFEVTRLIHPGDNLVEVRADNTYNPDIPPLSADFTFFGGMYRDVNLVVTDPLHVSTTHYASPGVYLSTPVVTERSAEVHLRTMLSNGTPKAAKATLTHRIFDASGRCVAQVSTRAALTAGECDREVGVVAHIASPERWDVERPYLYTVRTTVTDAAGRVTDEVANPLGIRTFSFDPDKGFLLNGRPVKLMGTNRHQDYAGRGDALDDARHLRDIEMLRQMGGNFLRVSHYPQAPAVLAACDRLGIVTSVEIPIVNAVTMNEAFAANCERMMTEMILQSYNSPSVCIWAYMNEVMLRPPFAVDSTVDRAAYLKWVYDIALRCESTARRLDPGRTTMIPCHGSPALYDESGISALPGVLGVNIYQGWYGGDLTGLERQLDRMHASYPTKPIIVTEFGADADIRIRSAHPERFDFSVDYAMRYHEHYIPQILARDFVAGATVWNLNDFYSEQRGDAVPHVNCKGLNTLDRRPKDTYFYYQAMLSQQPVIHICGGDRGFRSGVETASGVCRERVQIYTNASEAELLLDGKSLGKQPVRNASASFEVPFHDGLNRLEAIIRQDGREVRDFAATRMILVPDSLRGATPFTEMSVLMGTARSFDDPVSGVAWIPERAYTSGGWGYVGGEPMRPRARHGAQPASNLAIASTDLDPLFQTQRRGLEAFRADLPDGEYEVYLYFAELTTEKPAVALAYQLGNDALGEAAVKRRFDIDVNGVCVTPGLDVAAEAGRCRPMVRRYHASVTGGKGLCIGFRAIEAETMLTAIRILKNY